MGIIVRLGRPVFCSQFENKESQSVFEAQVCLSVALIKGVQLTCQLSALRS